MKGRQNGPEGFRVALLREQLDWQARKTSYPVLLILEPGLRVDFQGFSGLAPWRNGVAQRSSPEKGRAAQGVSRICSSWLRISSSVQLL